MLTVHEIAKRLDVSPETVKIWQRAGLLLAHRYNDKGQCLFEPPSADAPTKFRHQGKTSRTTPTIKANIPTTHV